MTETRHPLGMPSQTSSTYHRRSIPAWIPSHSRDGGKTFKSPDTYAEVDNNQFPPPRKSPGDDIFRDQQAERRCAPRYRYGKSRLFGQQGGRN